MHGNTQKQQQQQPVPDKLMFFFSVPCLCATLFFPARRCFVFAALRNALFPSSAIVGMLLIYFTRKWIVCEKMCENLVLQQFNKLQLLCLHNLSAVLFFIYLPLLSFCLMSTDKQIATQQIEIKIFILKLKVPQSYSPTILCEHFLFFSSLSDIVLFCLYHFRCHIRARNRWSPISI